MKVLNLQCSHQHSFERWFVSEVDFQSQLSRGLIECPLCADKGVQKLPSAPRLNLGGHSNSDSAARAGQTTPSGAAVPVSTESFRDNGATEVTNTPSGKNHAEQAAFLKALRHVLAHSEDVGTRFAEEARRMHYGEREAGSIRGQTSAREAVGLMEEGIDVMPLPLPAMAKETLQ